MMLRYLLLKRTYRTNPNTIQWNKTIRNHQLNGNYQQAIKLFQIGIEKKTFEPNTVTYLTILDICKELKSLSTLKTIHHLIDKSNEFSNDPHIRSLLMNVYINCQDLDNAYQVFKSMNQRNLIDFCGIITGFNNNKQYDKTIELSKQIPLSIKYSSPILATLILQACIELKQYDYGYHIHQNTKHLIPKDKLYLNELINFYLKFHQEKQVLHLFDKYYQYLTIIDYSLLMKYYNHQYQPDKTIQLYNQLKKHSNIQIDHIIYVLVLQAIANGCCLHTSQLIQNDLKKFQTNIDVNNALINMYGKIGDLNQAEKIFHSMSKHNIVSYNILLNLYGLYHQSDKALKIYNQMCQQGHRPDDKTYVLLLHTLSQTPNKINDVKRIFFNIEENQRGPMLVSTMLAALIRAGLSTEVDDLLKKFPKENILFYAIKSNINQSIDDKYNYPISVTNEHIPLYDLLISNMYTYAGLHDRLSIIDEMLHKNEKLKSILSYSWYEKSNGMIEYFKSTNSQLSNCEHTEKLALSHALNELSTSSLPILIGKNHRTCSQCHEYFKNISSSSKKSIYLRDSSGFHLFSIGKCSCEVCS